MKKAILSLLILSLTVFSFASGQQGEQENESPSLQMWLMGSEKESTKAFMDESLAQFYKEKNVDVSYQFVSWGDGFKKISTAIAAGDGPDLTEVGTTWVANFQATGAFENLTASVGTMLPDSSEFTPGAWATSGYDGEVYAIPWYSDIKGMIYRKDLWAEAGFPEGPRTWDDIVTGGRAIMKAHPELDSVLGLRGQGFGHFVGSMIWQNGGDFISEDGKSATWNNPANVEAMEWFASLIEEGIVSYENGEWTNDDIIARFWNGKIALLYGGPDFESLGSDEQIAADRDKIVVSSQVDGFHGGHYGFVGGSDLMIFDYSENKMEAKQLLSFLSRPEIQVLRTKNTMDAPAVAKAFDMPFMKEGWWPGFYEAAQNGRHFPIHPAWGDMEYLMPELKSSIYSAFIDGTYDSGTVKDLLDSSNNIAQNKIDALGGISVNYHWEWPESR